MSAADPYSYHSLSRIVEAKQKDARRAAAESHLGAAAKLLRGSARARRSLADLEPVREDRYKRFREANKDEQRAEALERGENVFASEDRSPTSGPPAAVEARPSVDHLIFESPVTWNSIAGLKTLEHDLKFTFGLLLARQPEGVNLPMAMRFLLYGPPGTGKTLLAAACSNMLGATFFSVSTADLLSKWFGESPQLIAALFTRARTHAAAGTAVVFIDEIEGLGQKRDGSDLSGAERRVVNALLSELDGLRDKGSTSRVVTIAATNQPWDLDEAILSRFEGRFFVGLPSKEARIAIARLHIEDMYRLSLDDPSYYDRIGEESQGFSGRMIEHLCKAAVLAMVKEMNPEIPEYVEANTIRDQVLSCRPLKSSDFEPVMRRMQPLGEEFNEKRYVEWSRRIGGQTAS